MVRICLKSSPIVAFWSYFQKICYFEFRHIGFFICKKWHFSKFTLNRLRGWVMYYQLCVVQNFTGSEEYKILYQIRPEICQLVIDRFDYLNIVNVMQVVKTWTYKLSVCTCIRAQILLLLPVMCFVYDVISGYSELGVFFNVTLWLDPCLLRTRLMETCNGISYTSLLR